MRRACSSIHNNQMSPACVRAYEIAGLREVACAACYSHLALRVSCRIISRTISLRTPLEELSRDNLTERVLQLLILFQAFQMWPWPQLLRNRQNSKGRLARGYQRFQLDLMLTYKRQIIHVTSITLLYFCILSIPAIPKIDRFFEMFCVFSLSCLGHLTINWGQIFLRQW